MTKIDLITGFLGAGKTTFLKKYAAYLLRKGLHIGILENDYGAVNVDMMLLQDLLSDQCELEMVAGGCHPDCHRRRFKSKLIAMGMCGYDRVLIEPSGVFDIDEFFDILHEEPLDQWYEIGSVIAVVDAKMEPELSEDAEYLLASEAANAGCVVMSRTQEASPAEIAAAVSHLNHAMETVRCDRRFGTGISGARVLDAGTRLVDISDPKAPEPGILSTGTSDPDVLNACTSSFDNLTTDIGKTDIFCKDWETLTDTDFKQIASCGYVSEDFQKRLVSEEEFSSVYYMNVQMSADELRLTAEQIFKDPACGNVWRIKGFLQVSDDLEASGQAGKFGETDESGISGSPEVHTQKEPPKARQAWIQFNATRLNVSLQPISTGQEVLIVIGERLDEQAIRRYFPGA